MNISCSEGDGRDGGYEVMMRGGYPFYAALVDCVWSFGVV